MSALTDSVIEHEALMPAPYLDSLKIWTVGAGRCLERNPLSGAEWKALLDAKLIEVRITNAGSLLLLDNDLNTCRGQCAKAFAFWPTLDEIRRDVLIEMAFQLGIDGVKKFARMLGSIASHDYKAAANAGLDSLWAKQTPARAHELMHTLENGE